MLRNGGDLVPTRLGWQAMLLLGATLVLPTSLGAQWDRPLISAMGTFTAADDDRGTEDSGAGVALSVLKPVNRRWAGELMFSGSKFDAMAGSALELKEQSIGLHGLYGWGDYQNFQPYLSAGVVGVETDQVTANQKDSNFGFEFGVGFFRQMLDSRWGFRVDARHRTLFVDGPVSTFNEWRFGLGLMLALGEIATQQSQPLPKAKMKPKPRRVVETKRPRTQHLIPSPVTPKPQSAPTADADADGVWDGADQCPHSMRGIPVNEAGCVTDTDGDSVIDYYDACPSTLRGTRVDRIGCPVMQPVRAIPLTQAVAPSYYYDDSPAEVMPHSSGADSYLLVDVHFGTGSSLVTEYSKRVLDKHLSEIQRVLREQPSVSIELGGHTDYVGKQQGNDSLSRRRAQAVAKYLVGKGIDRRRLEINGYGDDMPTHTNETAEGRLMNRRVEILVHQNWR